MLPVYVSIITAHQVLQSFALARGQLKVMRSRDIMKHENDFLSFIKRIFFCLWKWNYLSVLTLNSTAMNRLEMVSWWFKETCVKLTFKATYILSLCPLSWKVLCVSHSALHPIPFGIAGSTDGIVHTWVHIPALAWRSGMWTHPICPGS